MGEPSRVVGEAAEGQHHQVEAEVVSPPGRVLEVPLAGPGLGSTGTWRQRSCCIRRRQRKGHCLQQQHRNTDSIAPHSPAARCSGYRFQSQAKLQERLAPDCSHRSRCAFRSCCRFRKNLHEKSCGGCCCCIRRGSGRALHDLHNLRALHDPRSLRHGHPRDLRAVEGVAT